MVGEERANIQVLRNRNTECPQERMGSLQEDLQGGQRTWRPRCEPTGPRLCMHGSRGSERL